MHSRSNGNLEMLVFELREKPQFPEENLSELTNNKLNPHMTPGPGIEPRPHWWGRGEGVGGRPEYPKKNLSEQGENQQQTQPTYDAGSGNRTRATLVGEGGRGWEEDHTPAENHGMSHFQASSKIDEFRLPTELSMAGQF